MHADLDAVDRTLLDLVQAGVPLVPRPFARLAQALGADEAEVLTRLRRLAEARVLRQIGAIFDTRACGYASALVAARVAPERLAAVAAAVGAHPGVSHCYERGHAWNLWFTLAVAPTSALGLEGTLARLEAESGVDRMRVLPALRTFKIAARFDLDAGEAASEPQPQPRPRDRRGLSGSRPPAVLAPPIPQWGPSAAVLGGRIPRHPPIPRPRLPLTAAEPLSDVEVAVVRVLQRPLALEPEPFAAPARAAGLDTGELLRRAAALGARGVMRRFAGLLNHRRAGFGANAMAVWALPASRRGAAGRHMAGLAAVTHCYERPTFPDWPYALFSMVHGRTREACEATIAAIAGAVRPDAAATLWTVRELKKTRLQLFTPEYEVWEAAALELVR